MGKFDNFINDLTVGREMEDLIAKRFSKKFKHITITEGKNSKYDIHLDDEKTIEVKQDFRSITTGNIVAEICMNGKPSALSLTKAYMWAIVDGYKIYYIEPYKIWECIYKENPVYRDDIDPNGDKSKIKCAYMLREHMIEKYCAKIHILTEDDPEHVLNFVPMTYKRHNYGYLYTVEGLETIWRMAKESETIKR